MMRVIRRIAILLIELVTEALFLGVLLGALLHSQDQWFYTLFGGVIALPVILALNGYYVFRVLAAIITRKSAVSWHYSALAATVFIAQVSYLGFGLSPDITPEAKAAFPPFLVVGASIVFAVSFARSRLFRRPKNQASVCDDLVGEFPGNE